jgi:outer membrane protein OmpA-like peptidoglycan-associated protein
MAGHVTPQAKVLLVIVGVVGLCFLGKTAMERGWMPTPNIMKAIVPSHISLPEVKDAQVANVVPAPLPQSTPATVSNTPIIGEVWEWNAMLGHLLANGGKHTTAGSLMAKRNVNLTLKRQDLTDQMQLDLIACASQLAGGSTDCSTGANYVIIMGDGAGQFAAATNPKLYDLDCKGKPKGCVSKYTLKVIAATGYSRGEDAFLAPPNVKKDSKSFNQSPMPGSQDSKGQEITGLLVEGVLRDGDWNIALKWAGDNAIPNNPDEKTFDPDAVNWINAPDYNTAATDYVAGKCEDRKLVHAGRPTGDMVHVCVNSLVTWTPGDVVAVTKKGGVVKVVSSKQNRSQMPAVIIGPAKYFQDNREEITNMLAATFEGGDQVKAFDLALHKAAAISSDVYDDKGDAPNENGDYWYRYYKGVPYKDPTTGQIVELGGSSVNNLDDNLILFGMKDKGNDNFRSTYTLFANIDVQQYPTLFKETPIPDVKLVEDKSFIQGAKDILSGDNNTGSEAAEPAYEQQATGSVIGQRAYDINFKTNEAKLTEAGEAQLKQLKDGWAITGAFIQVDGYTDSTGNEDHNLELSKGRAAAVVTYLHTNWPTNFPAKRFKATGHGSQDPVASNATAEGKAQNRRVTITLLGK